MFERPWLGHCENSLEASREYDSAKQTLRELGSYGQPDPPPPPRVDVMLSPAYLTISGPHTAGMKYLSTSL